MFFILIEKSVVVVERWDGAPVQCLNKGCFENRYDACSFIKNHSSKVLCS